MENLLKNQPSWMDLWAKQLSAERNAPSKPYLTDEWLPTDERLWTRVLNVAKGRKRQMTRVGPDGPRTIHAPNHGRGFRHWPNPRAVAWAVKQYNGYGGRWKGKGEESTKASSEEDLEVLNRYQRQALVTMVLGSVLTTIADSQESSWMQVLERQGLVRHVQARLGRPETYWDITKEGSFVIVASLADELTQRMEKLLTGPYDSNEAKVVGKWFEDNFRLKSPKTPRGQKGLKDELVKLGWYLQHGTDWYAASVKQSWDIIRPKMGDLIRYFSNEGIKVVPNELKLGQTLYLNRAGLDEKTLTKYAQRLEQLFGTIQGWRKKALQGGLKVAFANPSDFNGTASGKYRSSEDILMVRTTPNVLKRGDGYASFDYILVHELGHRYSFKVRDTDIDFDRPEWWTSKYSMKEGESFAELFAIGHYNYTGPWKPETIERFEKVMS